MSALQSQPYRLFFNSLRSLESRKSYLIYIRKYMQLQGLDDLMQETDARESFDPNEVRTWLVAEAHWNPGDAQAVYKIVSHIRDGKKLRTNHWRNFWGDNIITEWRKET